MKEIIIATKNAGKAKEFEHIFKPYNGLKSMLLMDVLACIVHVMPVRDEMMRIIF